MENTINRLFPGTNKRTGYEMFIVGEFIPPNKKFDIVDITIPDSNASDIADYIRAKCRLVIGYTSVFGKQYTYDSDVG